MITTEEDITIIPEMQWFWRSTNSTEKKTLISTTLSKFLKEDRT